MIDDFCSRECSENPEIFIALKSYISDPSGFVQWVVSGEESTRNNCLGIGAFRYYFTEGGEIFPLINVHANNVIGTITVNDFIDAGVHYLIVEIDTNDDSLLFAHTYLYVGTSAGYDAYFYEYMGKMCPWFYTWPFQDDELSDIRTFIIPFANITEK